MTPTRQIIVGIDIAFVDLVNSYPVDTSALPDDVAFVGEDGGYRWIERDPFAGREIEIDAETSEAIDAIFADADAQHQARLDAEAAAADDTTTDTTGAA
ncbi:hypothetical protein BTW10_09925 [Chromohalobacter japonicus]|uniref:Uncharacterized protein n=2 Tax=Chromohalobacter TaxID=42054 RepID=A0A1Q8TCJ8_9GAMM|nr:MULTISPECIES: hypothetical protein [Chromohalobacter]MCK2047004.1 hypothetical protein [Chromohalobacter moromii]MCT8506581.1 hypothetical protein [Chromohalobacter moromii]OLO11396.1 hypothetical protein BTW10_09925 [Chromohalobacter japonicus]